MCSSCSRGNMDFGGTLAYDLMHRKGTHALFYLSVKARFLQKFRREFTTDLLLFSGPTALAAAALAQIELGSTGGMRLWKNGSNRLSPPTRTGGELEKRTSQANRKGRVNQAWATPKSRR